MLRYQVTSQSAIRNLCRYPPYRKKETAGRGGGNTSQRTKNSTEVTSGKPGAENWKD
jgi:hypothetical protein